MLSSRDKAAYYRVWHTLQRAGQPRPRQAAPGTPTPFETALLALGEESGKLEECLRLLADYYAAEYRMVMKVMRKAAYPLMTGMLATFIAPFPLLFKGGTAPYVVTVVVGMVGWVLAGRALLWAVARWYLRQPKYVLGRLLRALTMGIEAGLPLGRVVPLAVEAAAHPPLTRHVAAQGTRVMGQPLAATFRGSGLLPVEAIAALQVAEASGDYAGSLKKLAELYES